MKILITGGAGFIGSNLANTLSENNEVTVFDNLSTGNKKNLNNNISLIKADIKDYDELEKAIKGNDFVFHLAAKISVDESFKEPQETFEINTKGTYNILKASKDNNVKKVIFASSAAIYGDSLELPKKEDMKPEPKSPYAFSKLNSEYLCKIFPKLGLKTTCLRFFNVYGPNQNLNSDYSAVIPIFINNALNNKDLVLYNSGKQTRDFIFVKDVVDACILMMKKGEGTYNVCSGKEITIKELAGKIKKLTNSNSKIIEAPKKQGDIEKSRGDNSKLKKFNWEQRVDMEDGLKKTVEYFKKQ